MPALRVEKCRETGVDTSFGLNEVSYLNFLGQSAEYSTD